MFRQDLPQPFTRILGCSGLELARREAIQTYFDRATQRGGG